VTDEQRDWEFARAEAIQAHAFLSKGPLVMYPMIVDRLEVQGRTYRALVSYSEETGALLHELTIYDEPAGSGLTDRDLEVPLRTMTLEAVARASTSGWMKAADGSFLSSSESTDEQASRLRDVMRRQQRTSWTHTVEQLFLTRFRELLDSGEPAIHRRLGAEFGVTERRSQTKVAELRKRLGEREVPKAPPGRRAEETDDGTA
jgi:hypothetical protein